VALAGQGSALAATTHAAPGHETHRVAGRTITGTVVPESGDVHPALDISCNTPGPTWSVDRTVYGNYFTWSVTTTCDQAVTMSNLSILYGSNGNAVSYGSDPWNQPTSQISSTGAFGPGTGAFTLLYRVVLTLPSGAWGTAGPGCSGVGTPIMECNITSLLA
jgi:hypothetical protein